MLLYSWQRLKQTLAVETNLFTHNFTPNGSVCLKCIGGVPKQLGSFVLVDTIVLASQVAQGSDADHCADPIHVHALA